MKTIFWVHYWCKSEVKHNVFSCSLSDSIWGCVCRKVCHTDIWMTRNWLKKRDFWALRPLPSHIAAPALPLTLLTNKWLLFGRVSGLVSWKIWCHKYNFDVSELGIIIMRTTLEPLVTHLNAQTLCSWWRRTCGCDCIGLISRWFGTPQILVESMFWDFLMQIFGILILSS